MLTVTNLSIYLDKLLVNNVNFKIESGQVFALIGESGSGKSLTALSLMRLLPPNACYGPNSKIILDGLDLLEITERKMRHVRGREVAMIFQDPMTSLNPVMTVGAQIREVLKIKGKSADLEVIRLLDAVKIPDPRLRVKNYPHELSGGMKQRVMIAMALAGKPKLLIADEPTTALDVTTQAKILELLTEISTENDMAVMFITHDLSIASQYASHIAVMHEGSIVEQNETKAFFNNPQNEYSKKLLTCLPDNLSLGVKSVAGGTILKVKDLKVHFPIREGLLRRTVGYTKAVDGISFTVAKGETLAIVGESGSGKTTVGKSLMGLIPETQGLIETPETKWQIIFQDPFSSLDPKLRIIDSLREGIAKDPNAISKIDKLLERVGLKPEHKYRYPHEFSGGERQRICIARALTVSPQVIVCDEPTSSLDVSVQAQVLQLLVELQLEHNLTYIFITHDISLVRLLAQRVVVMYRGKIVEYGAVTEVLNSPKHEYTKELLSSVPTLID